MSNMISTTCSESSILFWLNDLRTSVETESGWARWLYYNTNYISYSLTWTQHEPYTTIHTKHSTGLELICIMTVRQIFRNYSPDCSQRIEEYDRLPSTCTLWLKSDTSPEVALTAISQSLHNYEHNVTEACLHLKDLACSVVNIDVNTPMQGICPEDSTVQCQGQVYLESAALQWHLGTTTSVLTQPTTSVAVCVLVVQLQHLNEQDILLPTSSNHVWRIPHNN